MKPEPKATGVVCTECGMDWDKHLTGPRKAHPTHEDCVRVLKAELIARPRFPYAQTFPFVGSQTWPASPNISSGIPIRGNTVGKATL